MIFTYDNTPYVTGITFLRETRSITDSRFWVLYTAHLEYTVRNTDVHIHHIHIYITRTYAGFAI